jgi:hypothetical protein
MTMKKTGVLVAALAMAIGGATQTHGAEQDIQRSDVPPAVLKAVQKKYAKARIVGYAKEDDEGKTTYEVTVEDGGRRSDLLFAPDGKILIEEHQIKMSELPPAVKKALAGSSFASASVKRSERVIRDEKTDNPAYEFLVEQAGEQTEIVFDQTGELTKQTRIEKADKSVDNSEKK